MPAGAGVSTWRDVTTASPLQPETTMLLATITNRSGAVVHSNLMPLASPEHIQLKPANVEAAVHGLVVALTTDAAALWVVLTTAAHGRFDDNCFLLLPGARKLVGFVPFADAQESVLASTLRVEHLATAK